MNFTLSEAKTFLNIWQNKDLNNSDIQTIICPSYTALFTIAEIINNSGVELGAQNVYFEPSGAYTGEISCRMLKETGCQWVIIGHSERRSILGETDDMIRNKLGQIYSENLSPILCIGETKAERDDGMTQAVLSRQLLIAFENLDENDTNNLLIAYEPVWAIGTGITATIDMISETHLNIRNILNNQGFNGNEISILYGGIVSDENASDLSAINDVDGFLIGGASLDADKFYAIYNQL